MAFLPGIVQPGAAQEGYRTPSGVWVSWAEVEVPQAAPVVIEPTLGHLVLAGKTPAVARSDNQTVAPAKGALALAGYVPVVARTENQIVAPATGSLLLGGYAPTLTVSVVITIAPTVGSLFLAGYAPSVVQTHVVAPTGAWRGTGGLWDWMLEVKPRRKRKAEEPKRKKVERIVTEAVAEAIADSLDDDLADIERAAERAIADTRQGVEIAKRELFEQWVRQEVARQRAEVLARQQLAMAEQQLAELVVQQAMEQAAARRARRLKRIALFLSVSE